MCRYSARERVATLAISNALHKTQCTAEAAVSAAATWEEVEKGISIADFQMDSTLKRVAKLGDLFKQLLQKRGRCSLEKLA